MPAGAVTGTSDHGVALAGYAGRLSVSGAARAERAQRESAPRARRPAPRPNPLRLYPRPPFEQQTVGINRMHAEVLALDLPALRWDLRRVRRALAAFTAEEREADDVSPRNPQVLAFGAYPVLFSDYLCERELYIRRVLAERGEEADA